MYNNRNNNRNQSGGSFTKFIVNIATIVSTAITCIRLAYYNILSIQWAALIMLGVVIFLSIGNNLAKIVLAAVALFLFVLLYSYGDKAAFSQLMTQMLTLIIVLIGLYIMIKGLFRR
jgi:hypothetical protein